MLHRALLVAGGFMLCMAYIAKNPTIFIVGVLLIWFAWEE